MRVEKGAVTDRDVKTRMERWMHEQGVFRAAGDISGSDSGRSEVFSVCRGSGKEGNKEGEEATGRGRAEELLFRDIVEHRLSSTGERYARLGLNAYQGNKARQSLLRRGLIEVKDMPTRTGRLKLLELTEKGRELALRFGPEPKRSCRHGGREHEYWKKKLAEEYRSKGWQVIEEYPLGKGKAVDLACFRDGRKVAVEIETGKSDAAYNLKKCIAAGFDEVRSVNIKNAQVNR